MKLSRDLEDTLDRIFAGTSFQSKWILAIDVQSRPDKITLGLRSFTVKGTQAQTVAVKPEAEGAVVGLGHGTGLPGGMGFISENTHPRAIITGDRA